MAEWGAEQEADLVAAIGKAVAMVRDGRPRGKPVVVVPEWMTKLPGYAESSARVAEQMHVTFRVADPL